MEAKNLPLKFAFVAVLILLCLYGLFFQKVKLGIDLRGGHSLIFEIHSGQAEVYALQQELKRLQEQMPAAADPNELQRKIEQVEADIRNLQGQLGARGDLPQRMIAILKDRIDPQGFLNLEMRPLGENRIEIRMPVGSKESSRAQEVYQDVLKRLEAGNIGPGDLDAVESSVGEGRQEAIQVIAGSNASLADRLARYGRAMDALRQARAERERLQDLLDRLPSPATATSTSAPASTSAPLAETAPGQPADERQRLTQALEQAEEALLTAQQDADRLRAEVLRGNVTRLRLDTVLRNYVPPSQAGRGGEGKAERERRMSAYQAGLDKLRQDHQDNPDRLKVIEEAVEAYKAWAQVRGHLDDPSDLVRLVRNAGVLEFRIAPESPGSAGESLLSEQDVERYKKILRDPTEGPESLRRRSDPFLWFPVHRDEEKLGKLITAHRGGRTYVLLCNQPGFVMLQSRLARSWSLRGAAPTLDDNGLPAVRFEFNDAGAKVFSELTGRHKGREMAILLDDEVYSAPVIRARISDRGIIEGTFTHEEVRDLARTLEAGSLPARLKPEPVARNTFGPAFGEQNLQSALRAGYYSALVVLAFMVAYYLLSGAIADAALALNVLLVMGSMSLLNAVFTLPGIAGVVLVIGMAVDANVLIYERLREEQAKGQSIRMALKNAYERAFSAIFDSNLTTLITCAILAWVGTEEIRGFAVTLGLGVVFNIFTAVYVTRWVYQLLLQVGLLKRPLRMVRMIGVPKIDWMGKRYYFWAFSLATGALGIGSLVWQGRNVMGIEFSSGTQAILTFKDDALIDGRLPDDELVRQRFVASAAGQERLYSTARVEKVETERVRGLLNEYDADRDRRISLAEWKDKGLSEEFFRLVDAQGTADGVLTEQELDRHLPARSYQVSTTENDLALIQDVAAKAFGDAMAQRRRIDFELLKGQAHPLLKVGLSEEGPTPIRKELVESADPRFRRALLDAQGGALFAVRLPAAVSPAELDQRIRDMRLQPDFADVPNSTEVIGLTAAPGRPDTELALLVTPADPAVADSPRAWADFARRETDLLTAALHRQEAIVATNFDPAVAGEARQRAVMAMLLAWLLIIAYLWLRFGSARWGLAAVVCLVHDVTLVLGLVAASGWLHTTVLGRGLLIDSFKIDLAMIAALLTIVGYSVNDTIVVFDRIRENRGKLLAVTPQVINDSINQTLSRTLLTGTTTLIVVILMYVRGGQGIHPFSFALLVGILFGTYSSIAVASPILLGFRGMLKTQAPAAPGS